MWKTQSYTRVPVQLNRFKLSASWCLPSQIAMNSVFPLELMLISTVFLFLYLCAMMFWQIIIFVFFTWKISGKLATVNVNLTNNGCVLMCLVRNSCQKCIECYIFKKKDNHYLSPLFLLVMLWNYATSILLRSGRLNAQTGLVLVFTCRNTVRISPVFPGLRVGAIPTSSYLSHLGTWWCITAFIFPIIYTFKSIFGAIWPVLCWCGVKPTESKTNC